MEIESEDGTKKYPIDKDCGLELGRRLPGFSSGVRTVSRRHLLLHLHEPAQKPSKQNDPDAEIRLSFQVIGKNPICVVGRDDSYKKLFRRFEKGSLRVGDRFSISLIKPVFFTLKKRGFDEEECEHDDDEKRVLNAVSRRKKRTLEREKEEQNRVLDELCPVGDGTLEDACADLRYESMDPLKIDPVKEFGFLVMGQEFDQFPKHMIRHIKNWNWFLEEPKEDAEDVPLDDVDVPGSRKGRRKKRTEADSDDDEWKGEGKEGVFLAKTQNVKRPKYSTRSKQKQKPSEETSRKKSKHQELVSGDNEDDDTLGGFIVDDEENVEEKEVIEDNDEDEALEEEFDDDDFSEDEDIE